MYLRILNLLTHVLLLSKVLNTYEGLQVYHTGFEPVTSRLIDESSTAELMVHVWWAGDRNRTYHLLLTELEENNNWPVHVPRMFGQSVGLAPCKYFSTTIPYQPNLMGNWYYTSITLYTSHTKAVGSVFPVINAVGFYLLRTVRPDSASASYF